MHSFYLHFSLLVVQCTCTLGLNIRALVEHLFKKVAMIVSVDCNCVRYWINNNLQQKILQLTAHILLATWGWQIEVWFNYKKCFANTLFPFWWFSQVHVCFMPDWIIKTFYLYMQIIINLHKKCFDHPVS